jgi:hypothetical protein
MDDATTIAIVSVSVLILSEVLSMIPETHVKANGIVLLLINLGTKLGDYLKARTPV